MLHEYTSPLECSSLNDVLGFGEESEETLEHFLRDAKEGRSLLLHCLGVLLASDLHNEIGAQVKHELVFAEERVLRKLQEGCDALLIVENSCSTSHKIHLAEFLPMLDYGLSWLVNTAVHVNDQLVLEPNVCVQEEVIEVLLEAAKQ